MLNISDIDKIRKKKNVTNIQTNKEKEKKREKPKTKVCLRFSFSIEREKEGLGAQNNLYVIVQGFFI